jgi:chemotaxis protein methyltransferase CheR
LISRLDEVRLEPDAFRLLGSIFAEHAGLSLAPEARPSIERRLRERLAALGLASFDEYYRHLRFHDPGGAELDEALDLVTVNETYFYRQSYQLDAFQADILPTVLAAPQRARELSIWSAGCATGEEAYSIAIAALESGLCDARALRVFGSDISHRCIAAARRGVYGRSSFRVMPAAMRARWFESVPEGAHVSPELRAVCHFGHHNLLDAEGAALVGRIDVIFCRNVLIYLDDAARRRVIDMFYERLVPGGFLLLGHSESLLHVSTAFELCPLRDDLVYRKPLAAARLGARVGR